MKYFKIKVQYSGIKIKSTHIVKATTSKQTLKIANKFGIAFPF
jgi:hypothetical protein